MEAQHEVGDRYIDRGTRGDQGQRPSINSSQPSSPPQTNNRKRRNDYDAASLGCGINFIEILWHEIRSASVGTWAARQLADLFAAGPTTVAFDTFRETYENFNFQLPNSQRNTRLDMKLEVKGAVGDLDRTIACIHEVLHKQELSGLGRVLKAADPCLNTPRVWVAGKDDPCSICIGKHNKGHHLRGDCPDRLKSKDFSHGDSSERDGGGQLKGSGKIACGFETKQTAASITAWDRCLAGDEDNHEAEVCVAALFAEDSLEER
ncbi:MAG: hypothetical protein SGPRY_010446 [Prymnesium sp.]